MGQCYPRRDQPDRLPILVTVPSRGTVVAPTPVETYVAGLARALTGPRRRKDDLLAEARDGLIDATEAYEADGLSRREAEQHAVEDFGALDEVVPGYRAELGFAQGRRTAVLLTVVMLAQPIIWHESVWRWNPADDAAPGSFLAFLDVFVRYAGKTAILGAVLALLACGVGVRYTVVRTKAIRATAIFTLLSCAVVSATAICLSLLGSSSHGIDLLYWVSLFVLLPLGFVGISARRCLRLA